MPESQGNFAGRRDRFRHYESPEVVEAYLQRLEREWPARADLAQLFVRQVAPIKAATPALLELCCGPGRLAQTVLESLPNVRYTGLDLSPPFLSYAQTQLAAYANRMTLLEADLSTATWPALLAGQGENGHFQAIFSMQSLHDVGDEAAISQIYAQAKALLLPGGFLMNADLIVAPGERLPNNPGRLTIARHLELLQKHGYTDIRCLWAGGGFGCVLGVK